MRSPGARRLQLLTLVALLSLLLFFSGWLGFRALSASTVITHLPGFQGPLPFHLETGYVGVDDVNDVQLFYYFIPSERNPRDDPLLLWLTGGPGCSAFGGLVFEIGPLRFRRVEYNGSLPTLVYYPYSWTKVSNIIFLDSPVGAGFSYSGLPQGFLDGDIASSIRVYEFLRRWMLVHPQYRSNPLYVAGDSYAGKVVPVIAYEIMQGLESAGDQPHLNLKIELRGEFLSFFFGITRLVCPDSTCPIRKDSIPCHLSFATSAHFISPAITSLFLGYVVGNAATGEKIDWNARVPYAHNLAIMSDELYESTMEHCEGEDYLKPTNVGCATRMEVVNKLLSETNKAHILEPKCADVSPKPGKLIRERSLEQKHQEFIVPPPRPSLECRSYAYYLSYYWANSGVVREALEIHKDTVLEWQRCNDDLSYARDIPSSIKYHHMVISRGYRALVYSGDHDLVVPHVGTQMWIKSLNLSIVDDWRSWSFGGQVAGYTRTFSNNLTFATVKGAGHTAPQYKPKECLAMMRRWLSYKPL